MKPTFTVKYGVRFEWVARCIHCGYKSWFAQYKNEMVNENA